ncbi:uncharacterized protein KIAA1755 homolog isoform X2 [Dasypus novemcinctus]|uniref:uncharacterized protein KIAA1755 homolog isoform X2 n=1 Tax=Dasypus novemcinctus TaxID=9361 RepID=UPI00265F0A02|nr:uncharacterized protein KIAA1755 homolog isoform X2 [Dasypus novemcinctus]
MDPPSLDSAIQHALAGLYPPFEATAPTVLGQVFRLLDSDFQGDGLSFLLDFLIPAKRLCEHVREAACVPYSHSLFLHEGWPLCLRDEVVVHLAPLSPLLLRQGDFYLQAEPQEEQSVCIMIKYLSMDLCRVDKKPVPESSHPILFTQEWLEAINRDFEGDPLHSCLVASENGVSPIPWTKIINPEFVDDRRQEANVLSPARGALQLEALDLSSPQELHQAGFPGSQVFFAQSLTKGKNRTHGNKYPGLIKVEQARPGEITFRTDSVSTQDLEGDYVALLEFSQERRKGFPSREVEESNGCSFRALEEVSKTKEIPLPLSQRMLPLSGANGGSTLEKRTSVKSASSEEELGIVGLSSKVNHKVPAPDSECQPQEPFLNVLESPLNCASGSEAGASGESAASKTQEPREHPENRTQPRTGAKQASSSHLPPDSPPDAPASETKVEARARQGNGRLPKPIAGPSQSTSSSGSLTPGLKFLFLKGQKQSPGPPGKASLQHDGPWKVLCSLYSPKSNQAKSLGKAGSTQTKTSGLAADSDPLMGAKNGFPEASASPSKRGPSLDEALPGPEPRVGVLGVEIFHSRIACLPGGRDRAGRPLLLVSTNEGAWEAPWCSVSEVTKLLSYLCTIPRAEVETKGLAVVIDARKQPPHPSLVSALQASQALVPASTHAVLFLGEKEAAVQLETLPDTQVEVLASLKALSHHVDPSQLPAALEGPFPYCHSEWVQFFQKLDPFLADLRQASCLLQASIEEFEKGDPPGGMQEAASSLSKSKELMEAVLSDPGLLSLQREGGATLARLQREASRLDFSPEVRSHLDDAAALYSLVDEQLHVLVTASNHLLRRLELRVRLGRLEAAIRQAQYRRGLELSKQAAQLAAAAGEAGGASEVAGAGSLGLAPFTATQRAFQAKLTHFYMAAERRRTDLGTLLHLHRFCKKLAWFHMDCQDLMTQLRLGKAQGVSPGDQRRLRRYLQRLASEFPADKLTAVGLQVASLSQEGLGQHLLEEARARHEEIRALLEGAKAHCPHPVAPPAPAARPGPRLSAPRAHSPKGEVAPGGRRGLPFQGSLGMDHLPKSCWPLRATRGGPSRNFPPRPAPRGEGQAAGVAKGRDPQEPPDPAAHFPWQRPPGWPGLSPHGQVLRPTGGSLSSDGTDSQTSLEDSPRTSPRVCL